MALDGLDSVRCKPYEKSGWAAPTVFRLVQGTIMSAGKLGPMQPMQLVAWAVDPAATTCIILDIFVYYNRHA